MERSPQLAALADVLPAAGARSGGRVILVAGEAGVGKTAFVRRFCQDQQQSARVLWGACDALFTPGALGPLLEIAEVVGGELEALIGGGEVRPHQVAAAISRELAARKPTVLVLEDVHWADEATLDVLRLLARRITTVPALVIATYRDDALDRTHPLRIALGELATREAVERLHVDPLSPEAIAVPECLFVMGRRLAMGTGRGRTLGGRGRVPEHQLGYVGGLGMVGEPGGIARAGACVGQRRER